jgi:hypothetical protein
MSLWSQEMAPAFNKWEAATPVDGFYENEEHHPQWRLQIIDQDDAEKHAVVLRATLQDLLQHPQLPKYLTRDADEFYPDTPKKAACSLGGTPLRDSQVLLAAIDAVSDSE